MITISVNVTKVHFEEPKGDKRVYVNLYISSLFKTIVYTIAFALLIFVHISY